MIEAFYCDKEKMISSESVMRIVFQYIIVAILIYGYALLGAFGRNNVLSNFSYSKETIALVSEHQKDSHKPNIRAMRRHLPPDNRLKITSHIVLSSGIIPEYKEFHLVHDSSIYCLPTSSSHYTPSPRDPPLFFGL